MKLLLSLVLIFALVATISATIGWGGPAYYRGAPAYRGVYGYRSVGWGPGWGGARYGRTWGGPAYYVG